MKWLISRSTKHLTNLNLSDGSNWDIAAADDRAFWIVMALKEIMQLHSRGKRPKRKFPLNTLRRLIVEVKGHEAQPVELFTRTHMRFEDDDTIIFTLIPDANGEVPELPVVHLSMVICWDSQNRGGVLLHGALAEWKGNGVILAGPGGRGKTSASKRLPHHWQSFCDDATLVMPDQGGVYWAHPWPTWSKFMFDGPGGSWDVQHAVPLKGIFFLQQAQMDDFEPLGIAEAACLFNEVSEQVFSPMLQSVQRNEVRALRLKRFDNICALAQSIPSYVLRLCDDGAFWEQIEGALNA